MPRHLPARRGEEGWAPAGPGGACGGVPPEYEPWSQVFKALGHPVRLYIAEQVRRAPRSVGQLARLVR